MDADRVSVHARLRPGPRRGLQRKALRSVSRGLARRRKRPLEPRRRRTSPTKARAAKGLAKAEQEATCRLSSKPSQADVEACLKLLGDSWPTQERPNVTPDGKAVQGMCLGAVFVLGGVGMAVSQVSSAYPNLCKLITGWVKTLERKTSPSAHADQLQLRC